MTSLSKDEISSFNPAKQFFIIDSNNLKSVENALYGYCIQNSRIIELFDDLNHDKVDGDGAYVYIKNDGKKLQ